MSTFLYLQTLNLLHMFFCILGINCVIPNTTLGLINSSSTVGKKSVLRASGDCVERKECKFFH